MDPQAPDHGLVLGAMALELGLVSREQLGAVLRDWLADPSVAIGDVLLERGHLCKGDWQRLEALVARQLATAGEAAEPGLGALQTLAGQTIGVDRTRHHSDVARTIDQTLRELESPAGRRFSGVVLTELNGAHQRFKLLRPHAKGGLGLVSVAHDVEIDREVAVKEMRIENLSDDAVQRFMMEAKVTGQLDHPGIPPVYALGYFEDGRPFYVMRLIDGVTLKRAVDDFHKKYPLPDTSRRRSLEMRKLLGAFVSVCHTLRYAHSRHVLHRDIKPSNIMLGNYGETLVLDWGLAKCQEESLPYSELEAKAHQSRRRHDDPTLTGTGSVLGTPHYMSPEQARGQWESVNLRSEVYSLGATLYTVLTGKLPFSGTTRDAVLEQVRQGNCRRPKDVDPRIPIELDAICMKAMALHREDRFASAGELASEIEHWLADEPVASVRETAGRRWQRWFKSHQTAVATLLALLATGLVAVVVGAVAVSYEHQRANRSWQRAEAESQRAEKNSESARHFVARFLTINFSDDLSHAPGSEQPRMTLLEETIAQLKQWAFDNPSDLRLRLDLLEAIRRRSQLFLAMNQPEKAWGDLALTLNILEEMIRSPDTPLHRRLVLTRLYIWNELALLTEQRYGPRASLDVLLPAQHEAELFLQQDTASYGRRLAFYQLNITLARQLYRLGRHAEAAELIDGAASQFEAMLAAADHAALDEQIVDGFELVQLVSCQARQLQAAIAFANADYAFAESCVERSKQLSDGLLQTVPGAYEPLSIKLDALGLEAELSRIRQRPEQALQTIRRTTEEIVRWAERYPTSSRFAAAAAQAELRQAVQELSAGSVLRATEAVAWATNAWEQLCTQTDVQPAWRQELARAHRVRAEIALMECNAEVAILHCDRARAILAEAAAGRPEQKEVAAEAERIDFVESQTELLR